MVAEERDQGSDVRDQRKLPAASPPQEFLSSEVGQVCPTYENGRDEKNAWKDDGCDFEARPP
jgi:hypothetical protein